MVKFKGILANSSPTIQLITLGSLIVIGLTFSSIIGVLAVLVTGATPAEFMAHTNAVRWLQLASTICSFLLPAFGFAYLCSSKPFEYLFIRCPKSLYGVLLTVFVSIILISPLITITAYINEQLVLPSFLSSFETWMRQQESSARSMTELLLADKGITAILFNITVIAILAGITEEFLFRGALGRILLRYTSNPHTVIWIAAIIFSAFHLQFYGFIPRILLGAYMGYLLYWSRSIWLPIFAHIVNNLLAIVSSSDAKLKNNNYINGDLQEVDIAIFLTVASVMTLLFFLCVRNIRKTLQPKTSVKQA